MRVIIFALAAPLLIAACAATDDPGSSNSPSSPPPPTPSPSTAPLNNGQVPLELFNAIVADAAAKAGVEPAMFIVIAASAVTWSDGSLGCPEPGMFYTQALVPGYRVILEAAGTEYDYHASQRGNFSLCPAGRAKNPVEGDVR